MKRFPKISPTSQGSNKPKAGRTTDTYQALTERHAELTTKADRIDGWLLTEALQARTSMEAAVAKADPDLLKLRDAVLERMATGVELVAAAKAEVIKSQLRLNLIAWARTHISERLAKLILSDEKTAVALEETFLGVCAILGVQAETAQGSK